MPYDTISVTPLSPCIGAEIGDIDLTRPLSNREVQEVHDALLEYQVIFFRDQPIDLDAHRDFARHFGELHVHVGGDGTASQIIDGHPEVRRQHFDENSKRVSGEVWHTDQSCAAIPPMASILHQRIVPPKGGGDTLFASMYAAYEELSPRLQKFLEGLTATHDGALAFDKGATTKYPTAIHPVIARHPETGRKLIYVNRGFTDHINELPHEESAAILEFLYNHCAQPHWQVRFRWTKDSIAFWDNRCTQHLAIWDYWPNVRSGYRIQVKGTAPPLAA
ncbi:MAG TPA: TauD/TfdA family dioxygenase [Stellaceae bacterium]|nr:TauD/TfdA family dioxygenase [Stellaceae bacterium]